MQCSACGAPLRKGDEEGLFVCSYCGSIHLKKEEKETKGGKREEFDGYIRRLAESGYIEIRTEDGICYYDATLRTANFNLKDIIQLTQAVSAGVAEGVTTAVLNQYAHT